MALEPRAPRTLDYADPAVDLDSADRRRVLTAGWCFGLTACSFAVVAKGANDEPYMTGIHLADFGVQVVFASMLVLAWVVLAVVGVVGVVGSLRRSRQVRAASVLLSMWAGVNAFYLLNCVIGYLGDVL